MVGRVAELERQLAEREARIAQLLATRNPQIADIEAGKIVPVETETVPVGKRGSPQQARAPPEVLVLSVPEAGRLLGLSRNSSYEAAKRGDIPTVRIGGRIVVPRIALLRMLEQAGQAINTIT
jgi:excisionase family DNA binding protein